MHLTFVLTFDCQTGKISSYIAKFVSIYAKAGLTSSNFGQNRLNVCSCQIFGISWSCGRYISFVQTSVNHFGAFNNLISNSVDMPWKKYNDTLVNPLKPLGDPPNTLLKYLFTCKTWNLGSLWKFHGNFWKLFRFRSSGNLKNPFWNPSKTSWKFL